MSLARSAGSALVLLAVLHAGAPVFGEEAPPSGVMSLVVENDFFFNSDRNYTNGIALAWVPGKESTDGIGRMARRIPWFPDDGPVRHGYGFGQNMYTPRNITLADPPAGERPYAGWLYASMGVGVETGQRLDQFSLTVGVVGPASLAQHSQRIVHKAVDTNIPRGWDTQLRNEPGMYVSYQRSWRELAARTLSGLDFDLTPHLGGTLGNVYTYANTGLTLRMGKDLPLDYGPPRIQPSLPGSGSIVPTGKFDWYLFAGIEGRAVARNIFLDGNTFRDSRSVEKEPFVGDAQWGVVLTWRTCRVSFTHVVRTREFETQSGTDQFGSFSFSMRI